MQSVIRGIHGRWGSSFLTKYFKFDVDFRNEGKNLEKVICFLENWIWIGCGKFSLIPREYLPSAVNVLTDRPKISHITKRNIFHQKIPQSDRKIW